ncbi:LacI family DNA-binding transcriptional regulator [Phytomonospora sp. NPDC050363]|uniref:LacI family DNA-binding transcriptional regulator n=1 Tax=Phytomonospora sp. NPDC050363 TaxID=3155642 RepID=UPI0033F1BB8F
MTASIKEVARRAGVSLGTVSNVLNRPEKVTPENRERVLKAIAELGYVRNDSARQLRAGRSRTVAIVVLDGGNPFFTDVTRGAEETVEAAGSMLIVCNSGESPAREERLLEMLEQQRVQGLLITPVGTSSTARLERLSRHGIPVVLVDRGAGRGAFCSVSVNDVLGGQLAAEHLLRTGHRHIAFAGGPLTLPQVSDRHQGTTAALAEFAAENPPARLTVVDTANLTVAAGRKAAAELAAIAPGERPTAVFCANDLLALGVLQELITRGLRVPEDMAIVGYDDIEFAAAAAVPLSSVRQPRELLGRTAAQLLLEEVEDAGHQHRRTLFDPELVVRRSSEPSRPA